jgi:hypothetical protein
MVQTFAQAWGIKPKIVPVISIVEPVRQAKPRRDTVTQTEPVFQPKTVESRIIEKIVEVPRIERIVEKRDGEYISVHYHKQLIYMLLVMHITSLVALLLVIFLKK